MNSSPRELTDGNTRAVHSEGKSSRFKMLPPPPPPRPPSLDSSSRRAAAQAVPPRLQNQEMQLTQLPFPAERNNSSLSEAQILQELVQLVYPLPNSKDSNNDSSKQLDMTQKPVSFRPDYSLGQEARSSSHMIIEPSPKKATEKVSCLEIHDFAWIKRSNGSWTYAILAYKSLVENILGIKAECLVFMVSIRGATKSIKKHQWVECIRQVASEETLSQAVLSILRRNTIIKEMLRRYRQIKMEETSWIPESVVLEKSDDVSLVTFVSL